MGEDIVRNSGLPFTIVRAAWFAQNFSEGYLRDPILGGVLPMPGGDIPSRSSTSTTSPMSWSPP
jgi:uncharacterized protein YbjT (DUF2867 family)